MIKLFKFDFNYSCRYNMADCFDRYLIRNFRNEESIKIITQSLQELPKGDFKINKF